MVWKLPFWLPFLWVPLLVLLPLCAGDCDPENLTDSTLNQMPEHTTQKSFPDGAVHTYKCMHGYRPFDDRRNATCRGTVWELDKARPLSCHGASCGAPGGRNGIDHGTFRSYVFTFPKKVEFDCERGYRLHSHDGRPVDSDYGIFCLSNGDWSDPPPKCLVVVCPKPAQVVHGDVDTSEGLNFQAVAHYSCNRRYRLVGPPSRQCQDNATWSGAEPTCEEVKCPTPVNPPDGVAVVTSVSMGANVTYRCLADGSTVLARCLPQGVWSRDAPRCPPAVPRFLPHEVTQASCCRRPQSWRCRSGGSGCGRRLFCCRPLPSLTGYKSLDSHGHRHSDDDHHNCGSDVTTGPDTNQHRHSDNDRHNCTCNVTTF